MCDDEAAVPAAEREIERVAALLGARALPTGTGGKMEQFLRRHCHGVAERLIAAGVLRPEGEL
jgi:thiamine-triphosphatase